VQAAKFNFATTLPLKLHPSDVAIMLSWYYISVKVIFKYSNTNCMVKIIKHPCLLLSLMQLSHY